MENYTGTVSPPRMYVRALYDYDADDPTSLSFRQGDVIQVLTQLESGWWDGVINGMRGWFPSNYCVLIANPEDGSLDDDVVRDADYTDNDLESEEDYTDNDYDTDSQEYSNTSNSSSKGRHSGSKEEEAAFWIPQATPDGRLYYFNTLTGVSTMELPLESPTSVNEAGPREINGLSTEHARPPPELMAAGVETEYDTDGDLSASDVEAVSRLRGSKNHKKRRSYLSNGASPASSVDSLSLPNSKQQNQDSDKSSADTARGAQSVSTNMIASTPAVVQKYFDNAYDVPLTWSRLLDDMCKSLERYREAVNNAERSDFVRRAEDISDHLRLILAAASGTTDNHSGNPSIISLNTDLFPHFRDVMSHFSKLVLSSHMAAADWAASDSYSKCLQEADGVLKGVRTFVEIAQQQRGEEIPRLFPRFINGHLTGGNWQTNGIDPGSKAQLESEDPNELERRESNMRLDRGLIHKMKEMEVAIRNSLRKLQELLVVEDTIISHQKHRRVSADVCNACVKVIEQYRPWMEVIESINLSPISTRPQASQFTPMKQKTYNQIGILVSMCQAIAAPLADEWAEDRGQSFEERIQAAKLASKDLEATNTETVFLLQSFLDLAVQAAAPSRNDPDLKAQSKSTTHAGSLSSNNKAEKSAYPGKLNNSISAAPGRNHQSTAYVNADNNKLKKFFGEVPPTPSVAQQQEEVPHYLRLDHEGEIQYDYKTNPPSIKGGTLMGLVEQLTRHDKYDSTFNHTFLLTYQSFTTASELFTMLIRRWSIQPPSGLNEDELKTWVEKKQALIRFRIVNVLKSWFETYWMEDNNETSRSLTQKVYYFARDTVATSSTPGHKQLIIVIDRRMKGESMETKRPTQTSNVEPPPPILPKNMKKLKFLDIDPTEFARQLTIIESRLYCKIQSHECLNKIWQKKVTSDDHQPAPNVKALILHSNRLTNWVAEMILTQHDLKRRVSVIKHFITIADKCVSMSNFSTLTSIISALGTAPIHRLNRTWSQVNNRHMASLERLRKLMGSTKNFAEYRETLHQSNPPVIPFFGVYLTDLTFIEDGIASKIKDTNLINFSKRAKVAEVIREIQQYQNTTYAFKSIPEVQDYVLSMMQSASDVHEMYERSLMIEPKEREDEKIARLLTESGFM